jgi:hypothetical protein
MATKETKQMQIARFMMTGFAQDAGFRVFNFDGLVDGKRQSIFSVRVDIGLARSFGIRLQELPLLCRNLLEGRPEESETHSFTLDELALRGHAQELASAKANNASHHRGSRKPGGNTAGSAWRGVGLAVGVPQAT